MPPKTAVELAQEFADRYLNLGRPRPQGRLMIYRLIRAHLEMAMERAIQRRLELVVSNTYNDSNADLDFVIVQFIQQHIEHDGRVKVSFGFDPPGFTTPIRDFSLQGYNAGANALFIDVDGSKCWLGRRLGVSEDVTPSHFLWVALPPGRGNTQSTALRWAPLGRYELEPFIRPEAVAASRRASQAGPSKRPRISTQPGPSTESSPFTQPSPTSQPGFSTQSSPFTQPSPASRRVSQPDGPTIQPSLLSQPGFANQFGTPPQPSPFAQPGPSTQHGLDYQPGPIQPDSAVDPNLLTLPDPSTQNTSFAQPQFSSQPGSALQPGPSTEPGPVTQFGATPQTGYGVQPGPSTHSGPATQSGPSQLETTQVDPTQLDPRQGDPTTQPDLFAALRAAGL